MVDFDECNDSELMMLAQDVDGEVHRGLGRARLIEIASGADSAEPKRQVNRVRYKIMEYVLGHWEQVRPVITCPAKSRDPKSCFMCSDVQVAECVMKNPDVMNYKKEE